MARPKKDSVDYFPHQCDHKTTMYILEQKYGNDGYAFWFKLLEFLGKEKGHWFDLRDEMKWEFLQAKTHLSGDICEEILNLLSKLNAIDQDLWGIRVVWIQNFMDGIADAYRNRKVEIPQRPTFLLVETAQNAQSDDVSTPESTQIKLNEIKLNESKLNNNSNHETQPVDNSEEKKPLEEKKHPPEYRELQSLVNQITTKYPKLPIWKFLQSHNRDHPLAIIHTLKSLLKHEIKVPEPLVLMKYLDTTIGVENGKYNAMDSEVRNNKFKSDKNPLSALADLVKSIPEARA